MKLNLKEFFGEFGINAFSVILFILIILVILAMSWGITVGVVYLICLCFGLKFNLLIGTGIWLIMFLLTSIFKNNSN